MGTSYPVYWKHLDHSGATSVHQFAWAVTGGPFASHAMGMHTSMGKGLVISGLSQESAP